MLHLNHCSYSIIPLAFILNDNSNAIWIEPGDSESLFFTVERNQEHDEYDFDGIEIWAYPPCEYELYQNYFPRWA